jgi:hypothetical protein
MPSWKHAGEWDPSAVDYELADAAVTDHVLLVQSAKGEVREINAKFTLLDGVAALGAETSVEREERLKKTETLRLRLRHQELRAAYLEVKRKERLVK